MRRNLDALADSVFDLLVIGGGITGAGVALDAALRGLRVALVEKGDFASGTSSVSSKLIHGGLRYLEHGDVALVQEALRERGRLLRNAAHLVRPLRFVIPCRIGQRMPAWKWRLGLTVYDLLAGRANVARSRPLTRERLVREFPSLRRDGLLGGAQYHDAQMDDARLCLEVLQSAVDAGAVVANYVEVMGFERLEGQLTAARCLDHLGGREWTLRARQFVNAAGPWVDAVLRRAGESTGPLLQPTKGVHIVCPPRGLRTAFLLLHPRDGRVLFIIPWLSGKTLIGTTDTFAEDPERLAVDEVEIAYLLDAYNSYFTPAFRRDEVLACFAGLRPLVRARPGEPSSLSREFRIIRSPSGLITVAGGKYTTYRRMAEVITDHVARRVGCRRRCRTARHRLHGAPELSWLDFEFAATARILQRRLVDEATALHLVRRYGTQASKVVEYVARDPSLGRRLVEDEPEIAAEFAYQRDHEMACQPADFLLRRTRLGLFHPDLEGRLMVPGVTQAP